MRVLLTCENDRLQRSIVTALAAKGHFVYVRKDGQGSISAARVEPDHPQPAHLESYPFAADVEVAIDPRVAGTTADVPRGAVDAVHVRKRILVEAMSDDVLSSRSSESLSSGVHVDDLLTIRTTPIYGVDTDVITRFLIMMRTLPAVPLLDGTTRVQPLWRDDLAGAVAASLSASMPGDVLEIAGPEAVTPAELYQHVASLIGRKPLRVAMPRFLLEYGGIIAERLRWTSLRAAQLTFSVGDVPEMRNALPQLLAVTPTPIGRGLRRVIHELGEVTPAEGVGTLEAKRFYACIRGSRYDAAELLRRFRTSFSEVMPTPVGVEPAARERELKEGEVVVIALSGRGHVEVRVEEVTPGRVIVATLRGHAVSGIVRFSTKRERECVRFEVLACDRAANRLDWMSLRLGGARLQEANWKRVVKNVIDLSGGSAERIVTNHKKLDDDEAARVERWIARIIETRRARAAALPERRDTAGGT